VAQSGTSASKPAAICVAGVSAGTVSNVISGSTRVSEDARRKVLDAIRVLKYQPNLIARSLRTNRTHTLGIVVPDLTIPFFPKIVRGAEYAARERGYFLIVLDSQRSHATEIDMIALLRQRVDGILLVTIDCQAVQQPLREARAKGIRMCWAKYKRPSPETEPVHAKAAGLYMICTISKHKAEKKGYADAMMLDWQGRVAECTGANIFFTRDGAIHTPIADCFLDGITRQTTIELAKKQGLEVIERRILPDELKTFNECFITGSAAEVTPVAEVGPYGFKPGNISRTLMDAYTNAVRPSAKAA
jgi:hypothetical protein